MQAAPAGCNQPACCLKLSEAKPQGDLHVKEEEIEVLKSQKHICSLWRQEEFIKGI